jgi:hypothetical protein
VDGERGTITFHHASALQGLLDLIEDGAGGDLLIEAEPQTMHYQRRNAAGMVTCVVQAVSVPEPSSIMSSDVWCAVRRWSGLEVSRAPHATFVIHTDGGLYPTAVVAVTDRLHRFSQGCATAEDVHVAKMVGLSPDGRLLQHVRLRCNAGPASALRSDVSWRVRRLIQAGSRAEEKDADEATDRLLQRCAACSEGGDVVTREEAASLAGVDVGALDGAGNWNSELASRYLLRLPAGAGDSVVPVSLELRHAVVAGLHSAIRRRVEAVSGRYLSAAGARQLLASPNLLLQLEGAAQRAGPGTLLWEEVRVAQEANPSMRVTGPERRSGAPVATRA